jgi:hypothetical protein
MCNTFFFSLYHSFANFSRHLLKKLKAHFNEILHFLKQQPASFAQVHEIDIVRSLRKRTHEAAAATKTQSTT